MTVCNACNRETRPFRELDPARGMVRKCGHNDCKAGLPPEEPMPVVAPALAIAPTIKPIQAHDHRIAPPPIVHPAIQVDTSEPRSLSAMVAEMRARLAYVRERLADLDALAIEERKLARALLAFDADAEIN
jgi:hypothetical protein